jgi:hypothetical protein
MAWKLGGTYFETCSCEVVCPCTASLALGADYDRCKVTLVFHVVDGDVQGTDVRIGDAIDFEIEDVVSYGVESGEPARLSGIFHPAGSELTIAKATRSHINAFGIQYEGKSGFSNSAFSWAA